MGNAFSLCRLSLSLSLPLLLSICAFSPLSLARAQRPLDRRMNRPGALLAGWPLAVKPPTLGVAGRE